ncbi:MAG: hypothetical protein AB1297_06100, partial [bacterium]
NMPVYYYISSTTVGIASDSYAQRTLYDFEDKWGFDPINMGFSNILNYDPSKPYLAVELSDQQLYWYIGAYPDISQATVTVLAGSRIDNNTGITLAVYTANDPKGADITFSGVGDLEGDKPGTNKLETYYAFSTSTTPTIPNKDTDLIPAETLNTTLFHVDPDVETTYYMWSTVDIPKATKRDVYRDQFIITVQNLP